MILGSDSSIHIENSGCNQGVQVGNNSGNITVNNGLSEADVKKILAMLSDMTRNPQNGNLGTETPEKQKWFRADTKQEIKPNELIEYGNMSAQLDGSVMRAEVVLPNKQTVYAEFDSDKNMISHVVAEGFPQEYTVNIPKEIIIYTQTFHVEIEGQIYNVKHDKLKFGGEITTFYDIKENKLQEISAKAPAGMKASIDPSKKEVTFIKAESVRFP